MGELTIHARRMALAAAICAAMLVGAFSGSAGAADNPTADVIGGTTMNQATYDASFPWMVGVLQSSSPQSFYCGGTLIAPTWVLTAAHCKETSENVEPKYIVIGCVDLLDCTSDHVIPVTASYQHPAWDPDQLRNDMMLVKLAYAPTPATPLPLASAVDDPGSGASANVSGWGIFTTGGSSLSRYLRQAQLDVLSNANCENEWGNEGLITSGMICAIHKPSPSRLVCSGDSGGPLEFGGKQIGIVSFGSVASDGTTCTTDAASVFTRVSAYKDFITGFISKVLAPTVQTLNFPNTLVGGAGAVASVTYRNDGENPVNASGASITGDYAVIDNTCSGSIAVGSSCTVVVRFAPAANGARAGVLTVHTDSAVFPAATVQLSGVGFGKLGPAPNIHVKQKGRGKIKSKRLRTVFTVSFLLPSGTTPAACAGAVRTSVRTPKVKKPTFKSTVVVWNGKSCRGTVVLRLPKRAKHHKVKVTLSHPGNLEMGPGTSSRTVRIK